MKNLFKSIALAAISFVAITASAQTYEAADLLVTLPTPPQSITRLDERCNFIVDKYWSTFNPKSSFSNRQKLDNTMGQFMAFVPYATADTVYASIDRLIASVAKAKPENLLTLAAVAEKWCYNDTAEYLSEELYFPFVSAVVNTKGVKGPEKARFAAQHKQLQTSMVGSQVVSLPFTKPDGTHGNISKVRAQHIILMFYDPECTDCRLAKARLVGDYKIREMLDSKELAIVAIYPGEASAEWKADAATLPDTWVVGAFPDADEYFTMRSEPEIYYLDAQRVIRVKDVPVDNIIRTFNSTK